MAGMENIRLLMASGEMPLVLGYLVALLIMLARFVCLIEAMMYARDDSFEFEEDEEDESDA